MSPVAAQRLPISLANEIIVASSAFEAYLIISAVRVFVRNRGMLVGKRVVELASRLERALVDALRARCRSGAMKSATAWPSVRNSGLVPTPKSSPARLPEPPRACGSTTPSVVPGTTVLFTTTTW